MRETETPTQPLCWECTHSSTRGPAISPTCEQVGSRDESIPSLCVDIQDLGLPDESRAPECAHTSFLPQLLIHTISNPQLHSTLPQSHTKPWVPSNYQATRKCFTKMSVGFWTLPRTYRKDFLQRPISFYHSFPGTTFGKK